MRSFATSCFLALIFMQAAPGSAAAALYRTSVSAIPVRAIRTSSWQRVKPLVIKARAAAVASTPPPAGLSLFADTFEQDHVSLAASGWTAPTGAWVVCRPSGETHEYCQTSANAGLAMQGTPWADYQVDAVAFDNKFTTGGLALLGRMQNATQYYQLELKRDAVSGAPSWYIAKSDGAIWTILLEGPLTLSPTSYYHLRLAFYGSQISAWAASDSGTDYRYLGSVFDTKFATGTIGVRTFALTTGRFDNVTVTAGSSFIAPNVATEVPLKSDMLTDSVGVNVDIPNMPVAAVPLEAAATLALGVRHVRIALLKNDPAYDVKVNPFLSGSGTLALGSTDCPPLLGYYPTAGITAADVAAFETSIGGRLEAYEALNEPDLRVSTDPHWASDTPLCMQSQTNAIPGIPFIGPALVNSPTDAPMLGNVSSIVQLGNVHRYFSGNNPGTRGWGGNTSCGIYGALNWALCEAGINSGTKPVVITETGYNSVSEVDEPTQAKYLSRAIFVNSLAGVPRSYVYCLQGYTGGDGFGGTGLLRPDQSRKPAYSGIQSVLGLFSDAGADPYARAPLTYSVGSLLTTMQHELFQKRNGTYLLAIWNETASWKTNGGGEIVVPPSPVTVSLPFVPRSFSALSLNDAGTFNATAVVVAGNSLTFNVDDHMTVFAFAQ